MVVSWTALGNLEEESLRKLKLKIESYTFFKKIYKDKEYTDTGCMKHYEIWQRMERNCTESPNDINLKRIHSFTTEINIRYI